MDGEVVAYGVRVFLTNAVGRDCLVFAGWYSSTDKPPQMTTVRTPLI